MGLFYERKTELVGSRHGIEYGDVVDHNHHLLEVHTTRTTLHYYITLVRKDKMRISRLYNEMGGDWK